MYSAFVLVIAFSLSVTADIENQASFIPFPTLPESGSVEERNATRYCTWENGARCYNLVEYDYDFYEAWGYCAVVHGAFLVGISSAQEDDFLRTKLNERYGTNNNIVLWTGGSKTEGSWVWVNGEPWGYTAWNSGEPSGHGGFLGLYGGAGSEWNWKERGETEKSYCLCES